NHRVGGGLDGGLLCTALRSTTDVESAHRQLGAWLADRLGRNNPDGLAHIDDRAARKVAAIAFAADADLAFASQHRADRYRVDPGSFDLVDGVLIDQCSRGQDNFALQRIEHIDSRRATEDTIGECSYNFAAVDDGAR